MHHAHELVSAQAPVVERRVPGLQVAHRAQDAPVSMHVLDGPVDEEAVVGRGVGRAAPRNQAPVVVAPLRIAHPQGLEDALAGKLREGHPAHAVHDHCEQVVAGVAVRVFMAGLEVERALAAHDVEHVRVPVRARTAPPAGDRRHRAPVAHPAGVGHEAAQGDRRAVVAHLRDVRAHVVIEGELPVQRQQDHRRRGELLGQRTPLEDGGRRVGDVVLQIRHAPSPRKHGAPSPGHGERASRARGGGPLREDLVDAGGRVRRRLRARGSHSGRVEQRCKDGKGGRCSHGRTPPAGRAICPG